MIHFSSNAKNEILQSLSALPKDKEYFLRIGIKGASCTGSLMIGFDLKKPEDELHIFDAIEVIIDKKHFMYVAGAKVEFDSTTSEILITV